MAGGRRLRTLHRHETYLELRQPPGITRGLLYPDRMAHTLAQLVAIATANGRTFAATPSGAASSARLDAYWTTGPGAARIRWAEPCAFCRCKRQLAKYLPPGRRLEGHCANLEKLATGHYPNPEHSRTRHCVPC